MKSRLLPSFVEAYEALPDDVRRRARQAYREWHVNPKARHFKRVGGNRVSARVDSNYRVLGILRGDTVFWYWIGPHDAYDRKLN